MNYVNTFIQVAADTAATKGAAPPERAGRKTIARLEYDLIASHPYSRTQEDVQFAVHVERQGFPVSDLKARHEELWNAFFSKSMACMRVSPLPKTYGWGLHFNDEGKVALVSVDSTEYTRLSASKDIAQARAMRTRRA